YRRTGDDMPATHLPEEIEAALHEGVRIHTLVNPIEVLGGESVTGVRLQRQRLADFDTSARRRPVALEADVYTVNLDYLISAIGQVPDLSCMSEGQLEVTRGQTFVINEGFGTSRPGVFAAGDAVSGPATIVEAVAHGNLVAIAVDQWLRTGQIVRPHLETPRRDIPAVQDLEAYAQARRTEMPRLPVADREGNFREVELGLAEKMACEEAKRCLRCDLEWLDTVGIVRPVKVE
ncbi:MAG TPA: FAD-dependent oxidoreductase, partial [Tepidisphaeraceae bacterium]|nr:FAD-dependent oxidoreductase [Tepidisphaeraceae bacterium]